MNLSGSDLSMVEIKFITEYPLFTFEFVGGVISDALKIMLMYWLAVLMTQFQQKVNVYKVQWVARRFVTLLLCKEEQWHSWPFLLWWN